MMIFSATQWTVYRLDHRNFLQQFPGWKAASFDSSFPDLAKAGRGYESLEFEDLRSHLYDETKQDAEQFKVLGIEFPARQVTIWGALIILAIQAYFLVYLRPLSENFQSDDPGWNVPWIILNPSRLAWWMSLITLTFIPLTAVTMLCRYAYIQNERSNGTWKIWEWSLSSASMVVGLAIAAIICSVLGWLAWRHRPRFIAQRTSSSAKIVVL